jgi:hypothetical protein
LRKIVLCGYRDKLVDGEKLRGYSESDRGQYRDDLYIVEKYFDKWCVKVLDRDLEFVDDREYFDLCIFFIAHKVGVDIIKCE